MLRWADELYQIYERFCGQPIDGDTAVLLPVSHSTANAQIEVTLSEDGIFQAAKKIEDKKDAVTIIPVTENSGSRSSGITPHPLADKLIYLAGDYGNYVPEKAEKASKSYAAYLEQLKIWAEGNHSHPAVRAIYTYLQKGCLIQDLLKASVLNLEEQTGKLGKEKICEVVQSDCMVRFRVYQSNPNSRDETWLDSTLYESWIAQNEEQNASQQVQQLCYATGKVTECSYKHPNKIRNAGDKAKLFSANDENGFSYRGRFQNKEQAISIGYDFSQKMHNALRWMIQRQGNPIGKTMMLLAWESDLKKLPSITNSSAGIFSDFEEAFGETFDFNLFDDQTSDFKPESSQENTFTSYRSYFKDVLFEYESKLEPLSNVTVMVLDSATTGRLSMTMYTQMEHSVFFERLQAWHEQTAWRYWRKKKLSIFSFSLYDIANCAYGTEQANVLKCDDKLKSFVVNRLLPCVLEKQAFPMDLLQALCDRAAYPQAYEQKYNWDLVVACACGMLRKKICEQKGECNMELDETCTRRDYLYGRLLAVAEVAESVALNKKEGNDTRITNARRYFTAFVNQPYRTWNVIRQRLEPYLSGMPKTRRNYYCTMIDEITSQFDHTAFMDNSKLEPEYLHAYSCQLQKISADKKRKNQNDSNNEEETES